MLIRITLEIAQRSTRSVSVRAVRTVHGRPELGAHTDTVRVPIPEHVPLGECELWELRSAVEAEIRGWAAKLPLGYVD